MTKHTEYRRLHTDPLCDYIDQLDSDGIFLDEIIMGDGVEVFNHPDQSGVFTSEVMHQAYEIEEDEFALVFERYYINEGEDWTCLSENFWIAGSSKAAEDFLKSFIKGYKAAEAYFTKLETM